MRKSAFFKFVADFLAMWAFELFELDYSMITHSTDIFEFFTFDISIQSYAIFVSTSKTLEFVNKIDK